MNLTDLNIPLIFYVTFIMVIWFESDIVQTIANLTNTRGLLKINEFHKYKMEVDVMSNYPNFLYSVYPSYITKLISCSICLCFWSTLVGLGTLLVITNTPITLGILMFPINYITGLLLYLTVRKLL
jgi:hypothetical protein